MQSNPTLEREAMKLVHTATNEVCAVTDMRIGEDVQFTFSYGSSRNVQVIPRGLFIMIRL